MSRSFTKVFRGLSLKPQSGDPADGTKGDMYVKTDGKLMAHDGTSFAPVGGSSGSGSSLLQEFKVTLNATQLLGLATAPIVLIPAPGPGKMIVPIQLVGYINQGSTAFDGMIEVAAGNPSAGQGVTPIELSGSQGALVTLGGAYAGFPISSRFTSNSPVLLRAMTGSAPTVGDGTLSFDIVYVVLDAVVTTRALTSIDSIVVAGGTCSGTCNPAWPQLQRVEIWEGSNQWTIPNYSGNTVSSGSFSAYLYTANNGGSDDLFTPGVHSLTFKFFDGRPGSLICTHTTDVTI